jgi:sugar lactone lactonase YvrE
MILNSLILLAIAFVKNVSSSPLTAVSAANEFLVVQSMGPTIDGASVDKFGNLFAINETHLMNLTDTQAPPLLVRGNESFFSSSRMTRTLSFLVGDATVHTVWKGSVPLFSPNSTMLQPNDIAISADESRVYLSGMNYSADTGDLWYYNVAQNTLHDIDLSGAVPKFFRTNGIELSPDDTELFLSSAENNPDESVRAAQIFRFQIDDETGTPKDPRVAIDLYETLSAKGLDPAAPPGLDPDGMRVDVDGNLFISLNSFQAVLKWNIHCDPASSTVINLETVQYPANLELAGSEGKDLYVIGKCSDQETACIDHYVHDITGRAFHNLQT